MSPAPAAPSNASVIACSTASASEWPERPPVSLMRTPPRIRGRVASKGWTSIPWPILNNIAASRLAPLTEIGLRELEILGNGDLQVARIAGDAAHGIAVAHREARLVRSLEALALRAVEDVAQDVRAEALRRLRGAEHRAVERLRDRRIGVHHVDGVGHRD